MVANVRVTYADLDLTREADAQILLSRIEQAAVRACGGNPRWHINYNVMPERVETVFKECREEAVARAIGAVHTATLSQVRATTPTT